MTASPTHSVQCLRCTVNFASSGLVTAEMFRTRHLRVIHSRPREQDILSAARATRRKIEAAQADHALRESKRLAKLSAETAKRTATVARKAAKLTKPLRPRRRK